jgi:hypothetical protein
LRSFFDVFLFQQDLGNGRCGRLSHPRVTCLILVLSELEPDQPDAVVQGDGGCEAVRQDALVGW